VRLLSNSCGEQCELGTGGKIHVKDQGGSVKGCGVHYTNAPFQTYRQLEKISNLEKLEELFHTAERVINQFHILLIMEYFERPEMNEWFRLKLESLLHAPRGTFDKLTLGHKRDNVKGALLMNSSYVVTSSTLNTKTTVIAASIHDASKEVMVAQAKYFSELLTCTSYI
jgi:hypothetical protein